MSIAVTHVDGKNMGRIMLYALSTCIWCRKTKMLLNELGVSYDYIDVDLLDYDDQEKVVQTISKYNAAGSFPTLIINENNSIRGFDEQKIREMLG
jgi:glutaredoxin-like protein NrdH